MNITNTAEHHCWNTLSWQRPALCLPEDLLATIDQPTEHFEGAAQAPHFCPTRQPFPRLVSCNTRLIRDRAVDSTSECRVPAYLWQQILCPTRPPIWGLSPESTSTLVYMIVKMRPGMSAFATHALLRCTATQTAYMLMPKIVGLPIPARPHNTNYCHSRLYNLAEQDTQTTSIEVLHPMMWHTPT